MGAEVSRWMVIVGSVLLGPVAALSPANSRAHAQATGDASQGKATAGSVLLGEWWTENKEGRVRFTKDRDGTFRGTTTCCIPEQLPASKVPRDIHNPNPNLRSRPTVGIVIIWKLTYDDGEYTGGYVYNPRDGKTYRIQAKVIDHNTIKIRGYAGIPLFGQSQIWKRAR